MSASNTSYPGNNVLRDASANRSSSDNNEATTKESDRSGNTHDRQEGTVED